MASKNTVEMGYKELANLLIASQMGKAQVGLHAWQVGHMNMRKWQNWFHEPAIKKAGYALKNRGLCHGVFETMSLLSAFIIGVT